MFILLFNVVAQQLGDPGI